MRARIFPPYPRKKHASGQARIRVGGEDIYLGVFGSDASRKEYARLAAEFAQAPEGASLPRPSRLLLSELVLAWEESARLDGMEDHERAEVLRACTVMLRTCPDLRAADFRAPQLKATRKAMASGVWMDDEERARRKKYKQPVGWCRNQCNHMTNRLRSVFRWAESEGLVPGGTWHHLQALPRLPKGQARETPRRKAAEEKNIFATIPFCSLLVQAMIKAQLYSGARPSETCEMRAGAFILDGPDGCWLYRLNQYKSGYLDDAEECQYIVLGPEAQAAIKPWLEAAAALGPDTFLWRPKAGKPDPMSTDGLYRHVAKACERGKVPHWCPYMLRHSAKRRIVRIAGIEAAKSVLRHRNIQTTDGYSSSQDVEAAAKVQSQHG